MINYKNLSKKFSYIIAVLIIFIFTLTLMFIYSYIYHPIASGYNDFMFNSGAQISTAQSDRLQNIIEKIEQKQSTQATFNDFVLRPKLFKLPQ